MLKDIVAVRQVGGYRLWQRFEDGVEGEVDCERVLSFTGVFAPLRDASYFAQVRVTPDLGTICWPDDADLDPVVLYGMVANQSVPDYEHERDRATH